MMRRLIFLSLLPLCLAWPAMAETRAFVDGSWQRLLAAHGGRPLAVHVWSLTCAPCLAELPRWKEFQRRHPEMGLVLISADDIADTPRLERILTRAGLERVESWAFADPFTERLRFVIDPTWQGELPITRLIRADGQAETVVGALSDELLDHWLEPRR